MTLAAKDIVIKASADGVTYTTVGDVTTSDFDEQTETVEDTAYGDDVKSAIATLNDTVPSLSGNYVPGDAGQTIINTAKNTNAYVWLQFLWDGTNGRSVKCICTSRKIGAAVGDKVPVSYSFKAVAAAADVP